MQRLHEKPADLHPVMDDLTHSFLGKIIQKAKWLLLLDCALQHALPPELASFCHVMNVNKGVLIIGVSSAAIATRLQFMASGILYTLQQNTAFRGIKEIHCKICAKNIKY
jgi:hypothetical protein